MTLRAKLLRARQLLAGGWSEPFTLDAGHRFCAIDAEGVTTFTVRDALCAADAYPAGWQLLEDVRVPAQAYWSSLTLERAHEHGMTGADIAAAARAALTEPHSLQTWLEAPGRKLAEVLETFDRAILLASRENTP